MPVTEDGSQDALGHADDSQNPVARPPLTETCAGADGRLPLSSQRLMADILNSVSEGVVVSDLDGRLVLLNPAAQRMFGPGLSQVLPTEPGATYGCFREDGVTPFPLEDSAARAGHQGRDRRRLPALRPEPRAAVWRVAEHQQCSAR